MSTGRGYLLPAGPAYTSERECLIVFIPDKDEYRRAFWGALDYLGSWLAWERDVDKRGKDAALAWREANELTLGCYEMAACDEILALLRSIDSKLGNLSCCDDLTIIGDVVTVTTVIMPGVGDPPATWGETPVADWDEWLEYVCYHAHKFVDRLVETAGTLDAIAEMGAWTIELFANVLRVLKFLTLVYPVSYQMAVEIYQSFQEAGDTSDTFNGVAAKFEAAREQIICAFINGTSVSDAVETALDDALLWTLLYQFNDYDSVQALVYEGTVDGSVYLAPVKRDDCVCDLPTDYYGKFEFDNGSGPFNVNTGNYYFWTPHVQFTSTTQPQTCGPGSSGNSGLRAYFGWGASAAYYVHKIKFKYRWVNNYPGQDPPIPPTYSHRVFLYKESDGSSESVWQVQFNQNPDPYNWTEAEITGPDLGSFYDTEKLRFASKCIMLTYHNKGPSQGSGWRTEYDDFEIWCDEAPLG